MPGIVDATPETMTAVARALANTIEGELRLDPRDRLLYATDASIYQDQPLGVVIPRSIEDVVAAVRVCHEHNLPILPRGGGTSLAGQCVNRAIVFDLSAHCLGLVSLDEAKRQCRVRVGSTIDDLNDMLAPKGLFFAPDPSTTRQATIGGCIGNNAAGSRSIMYGRTAENLLGVDVCLADGRRVLLNQGAAMRDPIAAHLSEQVAAIVKPRAKLIRERFPKTLRRNAGYALDMMLDQIEAGAGGLEKMNLAHLICGSEGTLAVSLQADLLLHPIPGKRGLAVLAFATLDEAMDALLPILDLKPSAVELLDDLIVSLARDNIEYRRYVELLPATATGAQPAAVLYVEFSAANDAQIDQSMAKLAELHSTGARFTDPVHVAQAWKLRKAGEPLLHAIPGHRKPLGFVEDNVVPPHRLAEFVKRGRAIIAAEDTRASFYAHASVGVLHVRPLLDLRDSNDRAAMERIAIGLADLARELGGVMSGEHGDGRARGPLLERHFGNELMIAFREVKALFDPKGLLNPGNIVEPGSIATIHAHTRIQPADRATTIGPVQTYFDYTDQGDFAHAVEMCNGAGVCRKKTGGVMCPSYMATLDERHSTRGRGNALRLAISGQLGLIQQDGVPAPVWDDEHTMQTLDLCLSCKACKSECPSNVDIARLKAEYTAKRHEENGTPLRTWILGHAHELFVLASFTPGLVNFINRFGLTRSVLDRVMGFAPERTLPVFTRNAKRSWRQPVSDAQAPAVLLYADSFATYTEPWIIQDAARVLTAFGYKVVPYWGTDAARAFISVGMLPHAIRRADAELQALQKAMERNSAHKLLFVEPSVLSAVTDDWVQLKCATDAKTRREFAGRCTLVEQFLAEQWDAHPVRPDFSKPESESILFHGHCHQKALWGSAAGSALLSRCFPGHVRVLDTTCCGMAGSFGYAAKRYDLSMAIGELSLLPAVREARAGTVIAAPGTSCRHQIHDGAHKAALHPISIVANAIKPNAAEA
jgi:FAD/FMN-containing dehydrogenase/Fe-S oxidoreductase